MSLIQAANQSPIITQQYLNTEAYTGDPAPGCPVSTAQVSGSIVSSYHGMVGGILTLSNADAVPKSDPTATQPLQGGQYQYVKFYLSSTGANAPGQVVFWLPPSSYTAPGEPAIYTVTPDATAHSADVAGITLGTPTRGNYWFIQIAGIAAVQFKTNLGVTLAGGTPAIGDVITLGSVATNVADDPSQSATMTPATYASVLGIAIQAPVSAAIKLVRLSTKRWNF